jgi:hypothetical protein
MKITEHSNSMVIAILCLSLAVGVSCTTVSSPAQPTEVFLTGMPEMVAATSTSKPTQTDLPATAESESLAQQVVVPLGGEATIDGVLAAQEWADAMSIDLQDQSQLLLMHAGGYLYLGVRSKPEPVTSICLVQADRVSILHSSAAIGTAVYQLADGDWVQSAAFEWCCRETTDSDQALAERRIHLEEQGWIASNGRMGNPEEVEYKIAMPGDSIRLAVNSIGAPDYESVISWPADLADDCSSPEMLTGPIPEQAGFSLEQWITLTISPG